MGDLRQQNLAERVGLLRAIRQRRSALREADEERAKADTFARYLEYWDGFAVGAVAGIVLCVLGAFVVWGLR